MGREATAHLDVQLQAMAPGHLTAVILAGGKSTRFGSDKASALLGGRPLLQWVLEAASVVADDVVVVRARGQLLPAFQTSARVLEDAYEARGPLAGMVTAFEKLGAGAALVLSCDAPLVRPELLRALAGRLGSHTAACGSLEGRLQPLPAALDASRALPEFRERVERGELALRAAFTAIDASVIEEAALRALDPDLWSYLNINTTADLARAEAVAFRDGDRDLGAR